MFSLESDVRFRIYTTEFSTFSTVECILEFLAKAAWLSHKFGILLTFKNKNKMKNDFMRGFNVNWKGLEV